MKRALWLLALGACRPPSSPAVNTCAHLAELGCSEGLHPSCAKVLERAASSRVAPVPLACLQSASSPTEARACGFVVCR